MATPPPVAATKATLLAAHQLLNNPPLSHTSPSAAEQWHHDIDQLIVTAINMPLHRGRQQPLATHSCTPTVECAPMTPQATSVARKPPVVHTRWPHHMYQRQASLRPTSGPCSTTVVILKIAASPSSVSTRGTATSRVVTSKGSSTPSRQHEKRL
jgi:hypothetical protein